MVGGREKEEWLGGKNLERDGVSERVAEASRRPVAATAHAPPLAGTGQVGRLRPLVRVPGSPPQRRVIDKPRVAVGRPRGEPLAVARK